MSGLSSRDKKRMAIDYMCNVGLIDYIQYSDILEILFGGKHIIKSSVTDFVIDNKECVLKS